MLEHTGWIANNKEHVLSLAPVLSNNQGSLKAWGSGACNLGLPAPKASILPYCGTGFAAHVPYRSLSVLHVAVCQETLLFYSAGLGVLGTHTRALP